MITNTPAESFEQMALRIWKATPASSDFQSELIDYATRIKEELAKQQGEPFVWHCRSKKVIHVEYVYDAESAERAKKDWIVTPLYKHSAPDAHTDDPEMNLTPERMEQLGDLAQQLKDVIDTDASGDCSEDAEELPDPLGMAKEDKQQIAHTDHPVRHYDRTCPGCNAGQQSALFKDWFDEEYPANAVGHRWKYKSSSVMELMEAAYTAGAASKDARIKELEELLDLHTNSQWRTK